MSNDTDTGRVERYAAVVDQTAETLGAVDFEGPDSLAIAHAVMAVADAEIEKATADLRAEVERLKRERDNIGCSRFTCADDLGRANRALAVERARMARVEALVDHWDSFQPMTSPTRSDLDEIRAALSEPEATGGQP